MTDKLRGAAQLALEKIAKAYAKVSALCSGDERWTMSVPVRPDYDHDVVISDALTASSEALRAALAQQDAQAVPQEPCAVADHDGLTAPIYTAPQSAILAGYKLADDERVAALCDLSYAAGMKAGWNFCISDDSDGFERRQNSVGEAIRILKSHRAPAPAQQDAQAVVALPSRVREAAYDQIDRFLRNNLHDDDYADYSAALDSLYAAPHAAMQEKQS